MSKILFALGFKWLSSISTAHYPVPGGKTDGCRHHDRPGKPGDLDGTGDQACRKKIRPRLLPVTIIIMIINGIAPITQKHHAYNTTKFRKESHGRCSLAYYFV